jgi:Uma2 family endonuclease
MSVAHPPPAAIKPSPIWPLKRFTVDEYHRLIESGVLHEDDRLELLDGWLVEKIPKNPPHDGTVDLLVYLLARLLPSGWFLRIQNSMTLAASQPEPDLAVVQGKPGDYVSSHPDGGKTTLVIEVANSSVDVDREKRRIYARAGVPVYWVVNLPDRCVEVFTELRGRGRSRDYATQQQFGLDDSVKVVINGRSCGQLPVSDIIRV